MTSAMKRILDLRARGSALGLCCVVSSGACLANPDPTNVFDSMGTTNANPVTTAGDDDGVDSSTAVGADGASGSADSGLDGTGPNIKLDVGSPEDTETRQDFCNFVDILFVIDNSLSMEEYQLQLALAWPTFVDEMWKNLPPGTDLHVGMTTTSFYTGSCSEFEFNCESQASASAIQDHYITPIDGNTGTNGEQGRLFEWDGLTYYSAIVGDDPADFKTWFSQAAVAAGETGCSFEMMSAAAGYAMHPANAVANEGFLRDEGAVLAIVILTDEPDKSPEGAQAYYDMIMEAKAGCGGDACVLITGLVDTCIVDVNNTLWQFFNMFGGFQPHGDLEDTTQYANVIGSALAQVIGETCDSIPPAG